jgi:DNA-binding NarL/FixJ family response regulator
VIRIQLGAMDRLLSDIVTDLLASEPDIVVVGRAETAERALEQARREDADVILLQDGADGAGLTAAALAPHPPAILTIAANGREGWIVRIDARRQPIEAADGGLAAAVRRAAERPH